MATADPFAEMKAHQKEGWALFAPLEAITTIPAGCLIEFAGIRKGDTVLDVGCGTGVAAITAARRGARVKALDLSPGLLERARRNASLAGVEVAFVEGDAEALPYPDASFDAVLSQFGHMFAPRPEVAVREMLRVLKPGGRIAFSTWPPEMFTGRMFALSAKYAPLPAGAAPPPQWGEPTVVRERLGAAVENLVFERELMLAPALSVRHYRELIEATAAPVIKIVQQLAGEPAKLATFREEFDSLVETYHDGNAVRQHFLMTRAKKRA